jgi:hypothetical protein
MGPPPWRGQLVGIVGETARARPRIGCSKSASSAFAYSVASIVCGSPLRSMRTRSVVTSPEASLLARQSAWCSPCSGRQHVLPSVLSCVA